MRFVWKNKNVRMRIGEKVVFDRCLKLKEKGRSGMNNVYIIVLWKRISVRRLWMGRKKKV